MASIIAARARRGMVLRALAAVLALFFAPPSVAQEQDLEYAIKATFLYKFVPFVVWPAGTFGADGAAVNICVVAGADPFGATLDEALAGQQIDGRVFAARRLANATADAGCHVAYIAGSPALVRQSLDAFAGQPVLTVTDSEVGADTGIVHFVIVDNRVRFEIDLTAAARNGLTISSRLLALAIFVRTEP